MKLIEELTNELKNEETALILMKKLKFSCEKGSSGGLAVYKKEGQNQRLSLNNSQSNNINNNNNNNVLRQNVMPKQHQQQQQQQIRNQQQMSSKTTSNNNNVYKRSAYPQQNSANNPSRSQGNNKMKQYSNYLNNQSSKPNGIINNNSNNNNTSQQQKYLQEQQRKMLQQQQQAASIIVEQTAAQKLAAAKLAVNKQLEHSLQQLPSLVTTPFDLILIPSSNHFEFAASVGLETVVNHLLKPTTDVSEPPRPLRQCGSCGSDYSAKWVPRKDGKVWCECCYRKDKKKLVAKQQEERIGVLLMRAVTQEKNIEKALALELEAARQQIEAFNSTLATAVSTTHKSNSPINHHPSSHRSLDNARSKPRQSTNTQPPPSTHNKPRVSKHDTSNHHHSHHSHHNTASSSSSSSSSYKNHFYSNSLERLMLNKDKVLGGYFSLINHSAFIPSSSSSSSSSSHHTPLRSHKPYSRPQ